jgi:hypothetical protein
MADFWLVNHGSLCLLRPLNKNAITWIDTHTDPENRQFSGNALVIEPRYVDDVVAGAEEDGLTTTYIVSGI